VEGERYSKATEEEEEEETAEEAEEDWCCCLEDNEEIDDDDDEDEEDDEETVVRGEGRARGGAKAVWLSIWWMSASRLWISFCITLISLVRWEYLLRFCSY
jgi:hypothetical protein